MSFIWVFLIVMAIILGALGLLVDSLGWLIFVGIVLFLIGALVGVIQRRMGVASD
jgi:hypothetical protein